MKNTTAIVLILISIGLFYTFISPQYGKTKALRAEAEEYQNVIANINALSETRDHLLDTYQTFPKTEVARLTKVLPDHIDIVRLAKDLDTIGSRYGITIKNIKVDESTSQNSATIAPVSTLAYSKVNIAFSFVSSYENFKRFVADIEQSLRITDIKEISFQTSETGLYEYRVSAQTYWLK